MSFGFKSSAALLLLATALTGCRGGMFVSEDAPPSAPAGVAAENASLASRSSPLSVGAVAPAFLLYDQKGMAVSAGELTTGKGAVLLFTPSSEAPAARPALEWARRHQSLLRQRGLELLLVTPQLPEENAQSAAAAGLRLAFLSDPQGWVARSFGVIPERQRQPTSSWLFLVGSDGRIHYADPGLTEPSQLLLAAESRPGTRQPGLLGF